MRLLDKLLRRAKHEPIEIEIDVIDQIILKHLIRHQTAPALDLVQEVLLARRTANDQQVRLSLIRLESLRLITRDETPQLEVDNRGRGYAITSDGKRLKKVLQRVPTSRLQTYL